MSVRTFVAVPLPEATRRDLFDVAHSLGRELGGVHWTRKVENLHVTMKFLGAVEEETVDRFGRLLAERLRAFPPLSLRIQGLGAFPSARCASVIWAGAKDAAGTDHGFAPGGLAAVARAVDEVGAELGFPLERRPFRGHITVGRARPPVDGRAALAPWRDHLFATVDVPEIQVYESRLGREGSTYVVRAHAPLTGGRAPSAVPIP